MKTFKVGTIILVPLLFVLLVRCELSNLREDKFNSNNTSTRDESNASIGLNATNDLVYDKEANWRLKYIDEQAEGFKVIVKENTLDERLSNVVYTTSNVRLTDLGIHVFDSGDPDEDELNLQVAGSSPVVNDDLCGHHLSQMLQQIDELEQRLERTRQSTSADVSLNLTEQHYRLARVLDSFGRYESGHLLGRTHSAGSYEECVGSQLLLASAEKAGAELVKSRYCWAKLSINKHLHQTLKSRKVHHFDTKDYVLMAAICIPESCHSKSFQKHPHLFSKIANSQFKLPKGIYLDENLHLDSVYCLLDRDSSFGVPLAGKLWFCFVGLWTMLAIYSTFFADNSTDSDKSTSLVSRIVCCLDLRRSWADFIESNQDDKNKDEDSSRLSARVNFDALNVLRTLATMYVVFGHSFVIRVAGAGNVLNIYRQIEQDPLGLLILVGTVVIDSFLLVTGMLLAYSNLSREPSRLWWSASREPFDLVTFLKRWSRIALGRYLRLLPLYYLVFWFTKGVLIYANGHLPLWDTGFNKGTILGACKQESWWGPLVSLSAYLPIVRQCMPQTWTIASDLQFVLSLTPIMLLFARRPHLATSICLMLCSFSIAWSYRLFFRIEPAIVSELAEVRMQGVARMFTHVGYMYTLPHLRFSSVVVGYIVGYYLVRYKENQITHWPGWLRGPATKASLLIVFLVFALWSQLPAVKRYAHPHHRTMFLHVLGSFRFVWSLANGIIFLRLVTDWKAKPVTMLRSPGATRLFKILTKLSYSILLIHLNLLIVDSGIQTTLDNYSVYRTTATFAPVYMLCLPISVLLHVLFEDPLDKLAKKVILPAIYGSDSTQGKKQQPNKHKTQ